MLIIGLTGSIAVGKSFVADILERKNFYVIYADIVAKTLYSKKSVIKELQKFMPEVFPNNILDKQKLANIIYHDTNKLNLIENIIHPLVRKEIKSKIRFARNKGCKAIVVEVPLLFEKGFYKLCDYTILVTSDKYKQSERVNKRIGFNIKNLNAIRKRQFGEIKKSTYADYIIYSGLSKSYTKNQLYKILQKIQLI